MAQICEKHRWCWLVYVGLPSAGKHNVPFLLSFRSLNRSGIFIQTTTRKVPWLNSPLDILKTTVIDPAKRIQNQVLSIC